MKDYNWFRFFMILFFVIFITIYISQKMGFYDYELAQKQIITQNKIKQFEVDIKQNKRIDINDYLEADEINYKNGISKINNNISKFISTFMKESVDIGTDVFNTLFK